MERKIVSFLYSRAPIGALLPVCNVKGGCKGGNAGRVVEGVEAEDEFERGSEAGGVKVIRSISLEPCAVAMEMFPLT
jgi:hypothetical protein